MLSNAHHFPDVLGSGVGSLNCSQDIFDVVTMSFVQKITIFLVTAHRNSRCGMAKGAKIFGSQNRGWMTIA
jgi:hypothetical protein